MGLCRDDLVMDISRHVNGSVHMFEAFGPADLEGSGRQVRAMRGRWQLMINGESYKAIVAEAAKNAVGMDNIIERVFVVRLLLDKNDKKPGGPAPSASASATRKSTCSASRPASSAPAARCTSSGRGPPARGSGAPGIHPGNAGSSSYLTTTAGAEMTSQEVVFHPGPASRTAYGPVGAWFLLFKAMATSATGFNYMAEGLAEGGELHKMAALRRGQADPHLPSQPPDDDRDVQEGRRSDLHPHRQGPSPKSPNRRRTRRPTRRKLKKLEAEAWEDFLDMTISQAILWASKDVFPEEGPLGDHALGTVLSSVRTPARQGAWTSGPEDIQTRCVQKGILLGLQPHDHGQGAFSRPATASGCRATSFPRGPSPRGASRPRPP